VIAASISAGAYAATGNKKMAITMGITAAAAMLPGGGAMVKAGSAATKSLGRVSAKAGAAAVKGSRAPAAARVGARPASSAVAGRKLADDLARREAQYMARSGRGEAIHMKGGIKDPRYAGGNWEKRGHVNRPNGKTTDWHWMYNLKTGKVKQFKKKY
jgi:hypothetical protein